MKEFRFKLIIILGAIALSVYLLHYTYSDYQNTKKIEQVRESVIKAEKARNPKIDKDKLERIVDSRIDSLKAEDPSIVKDREKRIKLGLDLQGGMYVVMEVNTAKMLEKLAKDPDANFKQALRESENEAKLSDKDVVSLLTQKLKAKGIRLSRYFGTIREDDDQIVSKLKKQSEDAVTRAMEIIRNRVDQYGVSEPSIQKQGSRRIIVELPGIAREEEAKKLLQGSALLEFKLVKEPQYTIPVMQKIDEILAGKIKVDSTLSDSLQAKNDSAKAGAKQPKGQQTAEQFAKEHPFFSVALINPQSRTADALVKEENRSKLDLMLSRQDVQNAIPNNVEFLYSAKPIIGQDGAKYFYLYLVNKEAELTGGSITDARANIDPNSSAPEVSMQMNSDGAREWARITGANIHKRIAIVLDGFVYSAPVVNQKIPSGSSQISGMADLNEAKLLEIVLKAGTLPAPVEIMEQRSVGPSLGQDSVQKGFSSALFGYVLVAIFMLFYYQKAGGIAGFSIVFTVLFTLAALAGFQGTLTMPGIAGIVLSIGMAVDSNVLIYERIREELAVGKTMKSAIQSGFASSFSAIFDSNVTNLSTGIILYQFGSGPIQGFAVTLMIGIISSLFSSLVITRVVFDWMATKNYDISIG
ncbi:MAG: protein translocase subunit SecD [Bacteroidota bacterium]